MTPEFAQRYAHRLAGRVPITNVLNRQLILFSKVATPLSIKQPTALIELLWTRRWNTDETDKRKSVVDPYNPFHPCSIPNTK